MCPLRLILVFFSAILAGYFAWRAVGSSSPQSESIVVSDQCSSSHARLLTSASPSQKREEFSSLEMMQNGFWVFIDMASGRYLWRNLKGIREVQTVKEKLAS